MSQQTNPVAGYPSGQWQSPAASGQMPVPMIGYAVHPMTGQPISHKSKAVLLLLSFFLGTLGIDRFYKGDIGLGILKLITLGLFGVWSLVDFIIFIVGNPTDRQGRVMI